MILLLALACERLPGSGGDSHATHNPTEVPLIVETRYIAESPALDLLLVIDPSDSAASARDKLDAAAPLEWNSDDQLPGRLRVGVLNGTPEPGQEGLLQEIAGHRWLSDETPDAPAMLTDLITGLTGGDGEPRPLDAALTALTSPIAEGWNAGFRREGAELHVLFLSEVDDTSRVAPETFVEALATLQPAPASVTAWAIAGGPTGCATAAASPRLQDVVDRTGGWLTSICDRSYPNAREAFVAATTPRRTTWPLTDTPDLDSLTVHVRDGDSTYAGMPTAASTDRQVELCVTSACFFYDFDPILNAVVLPEYVPGAHATLTFTYAPLRARSTPAVLPEASP